MLNLLVVSGVFPWALNLLIGIFVFAKNPRHITNQKFCIFSSSIAFWSVGSFVVQPHVISNLSTAVFAAKICYFAACFLPILFLDFASSLSKVKIKNPIILPSLYLFGVFLAIVLFGSNLFLAGLRELPNLHFRVSKPGPIYYLFFVYFCFCIFWALTILLRGIRAGPAAKSNQLKYVFAAYLVAALSGFEYFLTVFGVVPYPPIDDYILIFSIPILSYAIVRHRLMDVEVIIKKTIVFAGLFGVFMAIVSAVTALTQSYIGLHLKMGPISSSLASVLIAVMFYDPVRKFLTNVTDKYLFQKKEDFKIILNRLSKNIISVLDLHAVGETVLNTLQESLRLETGALIIRDKKSIHYSLLNAFNLDQEGQRFPIDCEFIRYFSDSDKSINLEKPDVTRMLTKGVSKILEELKAVICVPLFAHGELIGLLTMGKKRSDQEFTQEEIDYLPTVASQTAIALRNAQLVDDVVQEREAKIRAEAIAKFVNYSKSIRHEIKNVVSKIYLPAQYLKVLEEFLGKLEKKIEEGFADKKKARIINEMIEEKKEPLVRYSDILALAGDQITLAANTAASAFSDDPKNFSIIYFRILWDAAREEANLEDCDCGANYAEDYSVYGNLYLLQRVFVNLLNNAKDAMKGQKNKRIVVDCSSRTIEGGQEVSWFEFQDNGPGIPPKIADKLFEQDFSTKPKPDDADPQASGYGQGLYVCRTTIEDQHLGKIWVDREAKGGAKFIFWLPKKKSKE